MHFIIKIEESNKEYHFKFGLDARKYLNRYDVSTSSEKYLSDLNTLFDWYCVSFKLLTLKYNKKSYSISGDYYKIENYCQDSGSVIVNRDFREDKLSVKNEIIDYVKDFLFLHDIEGEPIKFFTEHMEFLLMFSNSHYFYITKGSNSIPFKKLFIYIANRQNFIKGLVDIKEHIENCRDIMEYRYPLDIIIEDVLEDLSNFIVRQAKINQNIINQIYSIF